MIEQIYPTPMTEEKYLYTSGKVFKHRLFHVLSIFTWICALSGFFLLYHQNLVYTLIFGGIMAFVGACGILSALIGLRNPGFNKQAHLIKGFEYWRDLKKFPSIDVFLPICGEDLEIIKNTWEGVAQVVQSYPGVINVYVLNDDGEHGYKELALEHHFHYLNRPNKGEMKKAGNLLYGYQHSEGDLIVIFDADFRPHKDFLDELLPYTADEKVGIVQSPQHFDMSDEMYDQSKLQFGAGDIQEFFYRIVQPARGTLGASICVGTNAIYRRTALDSIGGTHQIEQSEDVWTGYRMLAEGWQIKYVPVILAKGTCPSDPESFYKQQSRWCNGSMSLMVSSTFWKSNVPWYTKLPYINGFMWYLSSLFVLLFPIQTFVILWDNTMTGNDLRTTLFMVTLVNFLLIFSLQIYRKANLGSIIAGGLQIRVYAFTLIMRIFGKKEAWVATGNESAQKQGAFKVFRFMVFSYYLLMIWGLAVTIAAGRIHLSAIYLLPIFWLSLNLVTQTFVVFHLWKNSK